MTGGHQLGLSGVVLAVHLVVIAFNLFGLIAIPLGGWLRWPFVRIRWWRWLHLASMSVVAVQALAGRACFLTILQNNLQGARGEAAPLIMTFVNRLIYWPLPIWVFAAGYVVLFLYAIALMWLVPPTRRRIGA